MSVLHDRLIGVTGESIPIHAFIGLLHEWLSGDISGAFITSGLSLSSGEIAEATVLKNLLNAAPDKAIFLRVLKNWLYLGELERQGAFPTSGKYLSAANLKVRLETEVTAQGGTLP